jgi:hypothetical protein
MKIDGTCHCGYITIKGEGDPEKTTICHCTDCHTGTGSAFRVSVPVSGATFRMSGQPTAYLKTTADSGNPRGLSGRRPHSLEFALAARFAPRAGDIVAITRPICHNSLRHCA